LISYTTKNILTIIFAPILCILIMNFIHISFNNIEYVNYAFFIAYVYLVFMATYYLLKKINRVNLKSDLNIWLLKILAGVIDVIVLFFLFTGTFTFAISNASSLSYFVIIINSILVLIISTFMLFRFNRRHDTIGIWK